MQYIALPTETVRALQSGAPDANGLMPERHISNGSANPCRHCLRDIPKGAEMLILSYRPFDDLHPYAETGPIFLCADACAQGGWHQVPDILQTSPDYLVKGYSADDRIVYGTGAIVAATHIEAHAAQVFTDRKVTYLHVRSARNNCYQVRMDRD